MMQYLINDNALWKHVFSYFFNVQLFSPKDSVSQFVFFI